MNVWVDSVFDEPKGYHEKKDAAEMIPDYIAKIRILGKDYLKLLEILEKATKGIREGEST